MHAIGFIQDLAVIMTIAGIVTLLFHRFKQPVVLGYIVAGIIIGPHTPPFQLIHDEHVIQILAELGVIFLMFSLGLEFSIKKLASVGFAALIAAASSEMPNETRSAATVRGSLARCQKSCHPSDAVLNTRPASGMSTMRLR